MERYDQRMKQRQQSSEPEPSRKPTARQQIDDGCESQGDASDSSYESEDIKDVKPKQTDNVILHVDVNLGTSSERIGIKRYCVI